MPLSLKTIGSEGYREEWNKRFGWVQVNRPKETNTGVVQVFDPLKGDHALTPPVCRRFPFDEQFFAGKKILALFPKLPTWDQNLRFPPLSDITSMHVTFQCTDIGR